MLRLIEFIYVHLRHFDAEGSVLLHDMFVSLTRHTRLEDHGTRFLGIPRRPRVGCGQVFSNTAQNARQNMAKQTT